MKWEVKKYHLTFWGKVVAEGYLCFCNRHLYVTAIKETLQLKPDYFWGISLMEKTHIVFIFFFLFGVILLTRKIQTLELDPLCSGFKFSKHMPFIFFNPQSVNCLLMAHHEQKSLQNMAMTCNFLFLFLCKFIFFQ